MRASDLTQQQRLAVAAVSGGISRMTRGYSTDPVVLGQVLGPLLAPEHPEYAGADLEAAELLRESGADEAYAALVAEDLVARNYGRGLGD